MRRHFRVGGDLIDPQLAEPIQWLKERRGAREKLRERDTREVRRQLAELLERRVSNLETKQEQLSGGVKGAPADERYVIWGSVLSAALTNEKLHRNLSGADLHDPKAHASTHRGSGTDALDLWVDNETPTGAVNGVNKVFTLANTPVSADAVKLYVMWPPGYGGFVLYRNGVQFTMSGAVLTLGASVTAPPTNSVLRADYRI